MAFADRRSRASSARRRAGPSRSTTCENRVPKTTSILCWVANLLDHLGAALRVGAVVLDDDLDRPAVDAAGLVDHLDRGVGGALVPAAVGGADAGAVRLEADLDRLGALRLRRSARSPAPAPGRRPRRRLSARCGERFSCEQARGLRFSVMPVPLFVEHWPNVQTAAVRASDGGKSLVYKLNHQSQRLAIVGMAGGRSLIRPSASTAARGRTRCRRPSGGSAATG